LATLHFETKAGPPPKRKPSKVSHKYHLSLRLRHAAFAFTSNRENGRGADLLVGTELIMRRALFVDSEDRTTHGVRLVLINHPELVILIVFQYGEFLDGQDAFLF